MPSAYWTPDPARWKRAIMESLVARVSVSEGFAMNDIAARGYTKPDVLVSTEWVEAHLNDPSVRLVESNEDTLLYSSGHIPGAVHVDWTSDLNDQIRRDYITRDGF